MRHSITTYILFVLGLTAAISTTVHAQDDFKRLPPTQISIDSSILASFTDEPCHHFEEARASLSASDSRQAAEHLRIGAAFLKLEAARATPQGREPLTASINELQKLADAVEQGAVRSTSPLDAAFMRAHYALSGHHCIKAAHRCCQVGNLQHPTDSQRASLDLRAAAKHLERASWWGRQEVDMETRELLQKSHLAANALSTDDGQAHGRATQAITALGGKLEALTGRKIILAPQVTEADELGPSIFR
jgi:hypothetical protein